MFDEGIKTLIKAKLPLVCPNPDKFAHEGLPPKAYVRQGAIADKFKQYGGEVFYIGKPYKKAFEHAMNSFKEKKVTDLNKILMVGDTLETDIRGANCFGMKSALTFSTGIMKDRLKNQSIEYFLKKDIILDVPHYWIERLSYGL